MKNRRRRAWLLAFLLALTLSSLEAGRRLLAQHDLESGEEALARSDLNGAEKYFRRALRLRPLAMAPRLALVRCHLERGDIRRAEARLQAIAHETGEFTDLDFQARFQARIAQTHILGGKGQARAALQGLQDLLLELEGQEAGSSRDERRGRVQIRLAKIFHADLDRPREAERQFAAARESLQALESVDRSKAHNLRASLLLEQARFERAYRRHRGGLRERLLAPALESFEASDDLRGQGYVLSLMGLTALSALDYKAHTELQEEARRRFERAGNLDGPAFVDIYLGALAVGLEDYVQAYARYESARERLDVLGQDVALRSLDLLMADLLVRRGQRGRARAILEKHLPVLPRADRRLALRSLGHLHLHGDAPEEAATFYLQALELDASLDVDDPDFQIGTLSMLAQALLQADAVDRAKEILSRALEEARRRGDDAGQVAANLVRADLAAAQGNPQEGLEAIRAALRIQSKRRGASSSPFFFAQFWQSIRRVHYFLFEIPTDRETEDRAHRLLFDLLEEMRHRAFRASIFRRVTRRPPGPELAAAIDGLESRLAAGEAGIGLDHAYGLYRSLVMTNAIKIGAAERNAASPRPDKGLPISLEDLQEALAPDMAAVLYAFAGEKIFALLIRKDAAEEKAVQTIHLPGNRQQLQDRVALLLSLLEANVHQAPDRAATPSPDWRPVAGELYRTLIAPLEEAGLRRHVALAIVPVGVLHDLPFPALLSPSGEELVRQRILLSAPSASALAQLSSGDNETKHPTLSNVPVAICSERGVEGPRLEAAARECAEIEGWTREIPHFSQISIQSDEGATESSVSAASRARLLHLASHGVIEPRHPLLSRLIFSREAHTARASADSIDAPHRPNFDGRLTVREILAMDLENDLVVLSSCRAGSSLTPKPDDWTGADLLGLSGAFLAAGARRVISSQLSITDRGAFELIGDFYRELRQYPAPEALARAQRRRLDAGDSAALGFMIHGAMDGEL